MTREDNDVLCKVGPGTPMGDLMRRYWLPVFMSSELEVSGAPKRVRILGEDLVGFRNDSGTLGLVAENCPHRGASLLLARNEGCGLRCLYHGWKISTTGEILETPAEPDDSTFSSRVRAVSYPVYESAGLIWAYLGPSASQPPHFTFDWTSLPDAQIMIVKGRHECNWAQALEGSIDTVHSQLLHREAIRPTDVMEKSVFVDGQYYERPSDDVKARIEVENTTYGFRYAAIRKPIREADTTKYVRITQFIAPTIVMFPGAKSWSSTSIYAPIDDEHTMFYFIRCCDDAPISDVVREAATRTIGLKLGVDLNPDYTKIRTRANNWLQDRAAMQRGDSFTGINGVLAEDMAVEESMGPVFDRTKEHLGSTDAAIIRMRQLMIDAARRLHEHGGPVLGLEESTDYRGLRADEGLMPLNEPWQSLADNQPSLRVAKAAKSS